MKQLLLAGLVLTAALVWTSCSTPVPQLTANEQFFVREVKPIFERNCLRCHNGTTLPGKIDLRSAATAINATYHSRRYITPGKPKQSLLVTAVSRNGSHPRMMPRLETSLTDDQIGVLTEWIEDGAAWPAGPAGQLKHVANPENP